MEILVSDLLGEKNAFGQKKGLARDDIFLPPSGLRPRFSQLAASPLTCATPVTEENRRLLTVYTNTGETDEIGVCFAV